MAHAEAERRRPGHQPCCGIHKKEPAPAQCAATAPRRLFFHEEFPALPPVVTMPNSAVFKNTLLVPTTGVRIAFADRDPGVLSTGGGDVIDADLMPVLSLRVRRLDH